MTEVRTKNPDRNKRLRPLLSSYHRAHSFLRLTFQSWESVFFS